MTNLSSRGLSLPASPRVGFYVAPEPLPGHETPAEQEQRTIEAPTGRVSRRSIRHRMPLGGYLGHYQGIRILDAGAADAFPTIGRLTGVASATDRTPVHTAVAAGAVFTMQSGDVPYVLARFAHQARKVRLSCSTPRRTRSSVPQRPTITSSGTAVARVRPMTRTATSTSRSRLTAP